MKSAARDRLSLYSALLPLPCMQFPSVIHLVHLIEKFICFFPSPSLTLYLNPFHLLTLPLPARSFSLFAVLRARPSPSFPFSRETLTTQSRFASYSHKPLKASHFRIFHSRVAHQLCHSHRCGHTSQRADTHRHAPHTHTHTHTFLSMDTLSSPSSSFFFFALHVNPKTCHN